MTETHKYPLPTAEREDMEEALGLLWHKRETGVTALAPLRAALDEAGNPAALDRLLKHGFVRVTPDQIELTPSGEALARDMVRRLRLAERLLADVLSLDHQAVDPNACVMEHIISPEVTESICTLLGHPAQCPHGLAIPPGACCGRKTDRLSPIVTPLSGMAAGESGRVAYLQLKDHPELHRLLALGVIPGAPLHVHQTFPAYVVEIGESQLALESAIAARIHVRRAEGPQIS